MTDPVVVRFLRERCEPDLLGRVRADLLWRAFEEWCGSRESDLGEAAPSSRHLFGRAVAAILPRARDARGNYYMGVRLRTSDRSAPVD